MIFKFWFCMNINLFDVLDTKLSNKEQLEANMKYLLDSGCLSKEFCEKVSKVLKHFAEHFRFEVRNEGGRA